MKNNNIEILSYKKILSLLLMYRLALCFFVEFVIKNISRRGDVPLYLNANPLDIIKANGVKSFTLGTNLAQLIIGSVNSIVRIELITHILFTLLAFYGIKVFLDSVKDKENKYYKILLLLCFLPAFNLWSSVAGKDSIIVFSMGIISAQVIRFFNGEKIKTGILFFLSLYLVFIIKQQYIPAVLQLVLYIFLRQRIKISLKKDFILLLVILFVNILIIYLARYKIDDYAIAVHNYFRLESGSTREDFFAERFDFFKKMPYLLPVAVWGPTITETKKSFLHMFAFIDSLLMFSLVIFMLKDFIKPVIIKFKIYYQWLIISFITVGWLFLAQYMQGIMNPGAAIRYRTNLFLMLIALTYSVVLIEKNKSQNNSDTNEKND